MTTMTFAYGMDWSARCVVILLVFWRSVRLVRAIQTRQSQDIWWEFAHVLGCAALLSADLSLYQYPSLAAPWLWSSANLQYLLRWPGLLFFGALASVIVVLVGPRGTDKGARRFKAGGAAILAVLSLLTFVEATRFRCGVSFDTPLMSNNRGRRNAVPESASAPRLPSLAQTSKAEVA